MRLVKYCYRGHENPADGLRCHEPSCGASLMDVDPCPPLSAAGMDQSAAPGRTTPAATRLSGGPRPSSASSVPETRIAGADGVPSAADVSQEATQGLLQLPPALASRFKIVQELSTGGAQADLLLVEGTDGTRSIAKIYRRGLSPNAEVLRLVREAETPHIVKVLEYGAADDEGSGGRAWELMEHLRAGSLRELMRQGPLDAGSVRAIVRQVSNALAVLQSGRVEHCDLKPENIMLRATTPLDLALVDFGISKVVAATIAYSQLARRSPLYAPPEAIEGETYSGRWDVWSLGMIVVEALTGRHPFDAMMASVNGDAAQLERQISAWFEKAPTLDALTDGVIDRDWKKLTRGLLRRDELDRWGLAEINRWLKNPSDPALVVVEEKPAPGQGPVLRFLGQEVRSLTQLADVMGQHWDEVEGGLREGTKRLSDWLVNDLGRSDLSQGIGRIRKDARLLPDAQVFAILRLIDPTRQPSFRSLALTEADLAALADRAVSDADSGRLLLTLHQQRILQEFDEASGFAILGKISFAWSMAESGYAELRGRLVADDAERLPAPNESQLIELLAAATPGASNARHALQQRAHAATTSRTQGDCAWFRELGDPTKAPPHALLALVLGAPAAEKEAEVARGIRRSHASSRIAMTLVGGLLGLVGAVAAVTHSATVAESFGTPALAVGFYTVVAAAVALMFASVPRDETQQNIRVRGTGVVMVALLIAAGAIAAYGIQVAKPRLNDPTYLASAMPKAFSDGDLTGLRGCWRNAGNWQDSHGYREFCFSGTSTVSHALDMRWNNGAVRRCVPWPGARLEGWGNGTVSLDLPQTNGSACTNEKGVTDNARERYVCRLVVGLTNQLTCQRTGFKWAAPTTVDFQNENQIFVRMGAVAGTAPTDRTEVAPPIGIPLAVGGYVRNDVRCGDVSNATYQYYDGDNFLNYGSAREFAYCEISSRSWNPPNLDIISKCNVRNSGAVVAGAERYVIVGSDSYTIEVNGRRDVFRRCEGINWGIPRMTIRELKKLQ